MKTKILFYGLVFSLILLLVMANNVTADTPVSGPITSDTTWTLAGSPYVVVDGVLVMEGVTLTIEPGVVVKFDSGLALQIDGGLIAGGTESNMITFTSTQATPVPDDWGYILFTDSSVDAVFDGNNNYVSGSILEYCKVEFGGGMLPSGNPPSSGTIRIEASSPFINYCVIENNDSSGIHITNGVAPKISYNTINNNSARNGGGIFASSDGAARITNNTIKNNSATIKGVSGWGPGGGGIFARGVSIIIDKNIVRDNSTTYGGGIYVEDSIVTNNIIVNNSIGHGEGAGIYAYDGSTEVDGNIITNNSAISGSAGVYARWGTTVTNNSIIGNSLSEPSIIVFVDAAGAVLFGANFNYNTVSNNIVPEDTDTGGVSINSSTFPLNYNNIYNNSGYALFNNNPQGSPDLNAENNWWGTASESEILDKIYDWFDDAFLGIVDYTPWDTTIRTDVPISPPTGLTATPEPSEIILNWTANPEADTAGYIVYWGTTSGFPYDNVVEVENVTSYTITGLDPATYYLTVTAYDYDYDPAKDDPDTIVNENQTNGNESWYAVEEEVIIEGEIDPIPDIKANGSDGPIIINQGDLLTVTVSLDPGSHDGENADWWSILLSSYGTIPLFGFQAPLFELPETSLFSVPLPVGWYIFLFGLDDTPDGAFELDWYDYVIVVSQPAGTQLENIPSFDDIIKEKLRELIGE